MPSVTLKSKSSNIVDARKPTVKSTINTKTTKTVLTASKTLLNTTVKTNTNTAKLSSSIPAKAPAVPSKSVSLKRGRENENLVRASSSVSGTIIY